MTWVPRTPKRADFCGCPPCPLCFDWAGDNGIVSGMDRFFQDMLGPKAPTANETEVLNDAAESIHVSNLGYSKRVDEQFKAADEARRDAFAQQDADAFLARKRREAELPKPVVDTRPCLDDMDLSKLNDPKPQGITPQGITWVSFDEASSYSSTAFSAMARNIDKQILEAFSMPAPDDKERRRIQAEADAKKRMKEAARGYTKVGK